MRPRVRRRWVSRSANGVWRCEAETLCAGRTGVFPVDGGAGARTTATEEWDRLTGHLHRLADLYDIHMGMSNK